MLVTFEAINCQISNNFNVRTKDSVKMEWYISCRRTTIEQKQNVNFILAPTVCTILSQTVFESQPFYLVSRCPLLIVVVSQPIGESVNSPRESVSSPESIHVRESTCLPRESVSPPEFLKELNRLATFYSTLLYFLNSSLSEFLK